MLNLKPNIKPQKTKQKKQTKKIYEHCKQNNLNYLCLNVIIKI